MKIKQNEYGELYYSNCDQNFHLVFNNLHFTLNNYQYNLLKSHILEIDIKFWLENFSDSTVKRKIPISTNQENLIMIFDIHEFINLKSLFCNHDVNNVGIYLSSNQIDYPNNLN